MTFDDLPNDALLREKQISHPNGPVPVCRSTWWAGVRSGRFPKPVHLGPRTTAWRVGDIRELLKGGVA
ncbi:AlpA family phage regulatory protein [Shimia sp. R9_3]|uniref:helix-turn-helix transcriptional regulator n=1 Tax=Shimia sp. R9_3 TaxID=2821113 RepID=UPI001ADA4B48|nr:AlpA family phage regulatory protein [Shimia sp. R9_3]MBO9401825.1 AlpA family phage regulatory protein [Shimia sp. R9_3]